MTTSLVEKYVADTRYMRMYQSERAIYEVTEVIESAMAEAGVTRAELAKKLGVSRGWVTQLLDSDANKTVRTVADVLAALGYEFRMFYNPIKVSNRKKFKAEVNAPSIGWGKDYPVRIANVS